LIAKRPDSVYEAGRRSDAWVKVKLTQQQEFVIGGYTLPEGSRKYFGALLVGYNGPDGLLFAGRWAPASPKKPWRSYTTACKKSDARAARSSTCQKKDQGGGVWGITPAVMKRCEWVEPVLVAQVKFTEWTSDDQLRQPVFLGLRTDKRPKDVVRE
jgi:bifunctional non-homologous end joining protein LigD